MIIDVLVVREVIGQIGRIGRIVPLKRMFNKPPKNIKKTNKSDDLTADEAPASPVSVRVRDG